MQYLMLLHSDPDGGEPNAFQSYQAIAEEMREAGILIASEPLAPAAAGRLVRSRDGGTSVTDGPYAETREQVGGFFLVDADDLATVEGFAARMPAARVGTVEIRPIGHD
jgi:hypothetical protein